ncbi:hypothetical protein [Ascidiimonas sp. W6]|uniref:hypothetical protein n=1 Tax=Ascidiimonas meishanensis TaxID=3128903 RepID=UPI0030EBC770
MMKTVPILAILLILSACASQMPMAQNVVLETKLIWKKRESVVLPENPIFEQEKQIPFLVFRFKNQTGEAIYFPKPVISDIWQLPKVNGSLDVTDRLERIDNNSSLQSLYSKFHNHAFHVYFQGLDEYSGGLVLLEKSADEEEEIEYPMVNSELAVFYKILQTQLKLDHYNTGRRLHFFLGTQKQLISYKEAQQLLQTIEQRPEPLLQFTELATKTFSIKDNKEQFIFLKAGESYEVQLNLIGFKLLGASYEFEMATKELKGLVYGAAEWDEVKKQWVRKKLPLPASVGDFNCYIGEITTNSTIFTLE